MIGATAPAKHIDVAETVTDGPVLLAELHGVSGIKLGCLVKFGMIAPGGIGADAANAFGPVRLGQRGVEMSWVGAVLAKGFAVTSIEEIITAVGITKSGFFYHFADKGDLAKALLQRYIDHDIGLLDVPMNFTRIRSTGFSLA